MGLDLAAQYPVVQATFDEANEVMTKELGRPLTDFIRRNPDIPEEEQFERLRDTKISARDLDRRRHHDDRRRGAWRPCLTWSRVTLSEKYAAAVAAGILSFKDALIAVSARVRDGRCPDRGQGPDGRHRRQCGHRAGGLAEIPGYVVPANKNCSTQTVIAGAQGLSRRPSRPSCPVAS